MLGDIFGEKVGCRRVGASRIVAFFVMLFLFRSL